VTEHQALEINRRYQFTVTLNPLTVIFSANSGCAELNNSAIFCPRLYILFAIDCRFVLSSYIVESGRTLTSMFQPSAPNSASSISSKCHTKYDVYPTVHIT